MNVITISFKLNEYRKYRSRYIKYKGQNWKTR